MKDFLKISSKMKFILLILLTLLTVNSYSQLFEKGKLYADFTGNRSIQEINISIDSSSVLLENLFSAPISEVFVNQNVYSIKPAFPNTSSQSLLNTVEISCVCDEEILAQDLSIFNNEFINIEQIPIYYPTYTPNDYSGVGPDYALELINILKAWDVTKGASDINIAIFESEGFDIYHEDLASQIAYMDGNVILEKIEDNHGTRVAGCAAAATDNGKGKSGAGFNCKLWLYKTTNINKIKEASDNGVDIISLSFGSIHSNSRHQQIFNEIYENGTIVVASAANGPCWERQFCPLSLQMIAILVQHL